MVAVILIGALVVLGLAAAMGITADTRDSDYTLSGVFAPRRARPSPKQRDDEATTAEHATD